MDENVDVTAVGGPLAKHFSVVRLTELRPNERILDDRTPQLLLELDRPTFVTIDRDYWNRAFCHPRYCILWFELLDKQQLQLPSLLHELLRLSEFKTRAARMGKVARITHDEIEFWQFGNQEKERLEW